MLRVLPLQDLDQQLRGAALPVNSFQLVDEKLEKVGQIFGVRNDNVYIALLYVQSDRLPGVERPVFTAEFIVGRDHGYSVHPENGAKSAVNDLLDVFKVS